MSPMCVQGYGVSLFYHGKVTEFKASEGAGTLTLYHFYNITITITDLF